MKKPKDLKAEDAAVAAYGSVENLTDAGFDKEKARAIASELSALLHKYLSALATKGEFAEFESEIREKIAEFESVIRAEFAKHRSEAQKDTDEMKAVVTKLQVAVAELKVMIAESGAKTQKHIDEQIAKITNLFVMVSLGLAALIVTTLAIFVALSV